MNQRKLMVTENELKPAISIQDPGFSIQNIYYTGFDTFYNYNWNSTKLK